MTVRWQLSPAWSALLSAECFPITRPSSASRLEALSLPLRLQTCLLQPAGVQDPNEATAPLLLYLDHAHPPAHYGWSLSSIQLSSIELLSAPNQFRAVCPLIIKVRMQSCSRLNSMRHLCMECWHRVSLPRQKYNILQTLTQSIFQGSLHSHPSADWSTPTT